MIARIKSVKIRSVVDLATQKFKSKAKTEIVSRFAKQFDMRVFSETFKRCLANFKTKQTLNLNTTDRNEEPAVAVIYKRKKRNFNF